MRTTHCLLRQIDVEHTQNVLDLIDNYMQINWEMQNQPLLNL
jgi:hypothetical protein